MAHEGRAPAALGSQICSDILYAFSYCPSKQEIGLCSRYSTERGVAVTGRNTTGPPSRFQVLGRAQQSVNVFDRSTLA